MASDQLLTRLNCGVGCAGMEGQEELPEQPLEGESGEEQPQQ